METRIKELTDSLPPRKHQLAMKIREIILKSYPSFKETIKWGNLTFVSNGNIANIYAYDKTDYINVAFFQATKLSDPKKLLQGTGKSMRHLKMNSEKDIDEKQIAAWVKETIKLNQKK